MNIRNIVTWAVGAAALALAACGGGGSSGGIGGTGGGGGGIGGTGVAFGTITDFGSVWVNGVEYSTSNTNFITDDHPNGGGSQADLRRGMVVRVDGSVSGATAGTITVDEAIKGFVEQVVDANRMVVMGQTVQIDNLTRFDNNVVPVQGDRVNVYGLVAGDGLIAAGFVEKKATAPTPPFAVKGTVKNQDTAAQTFQVGTLTVQYAGATVNDMPAGAWNGLQVDVKGSACAGPAPVCGTLVATKVEPAGAKVASASQAEIEGIVTALSGSGFTIGNLAVVTTATTRYEGGLASEIAVGTKLEVEGAISGGVLTAVKVSFRDNIRLEGDIATISAGAGTLSIAGLPGVTVSVNALTEYKGGIGSLSGLAAPNHLRIRGRPGAGNTVIATEVELRSTSSDTRVILQAAASAVAAPNVTLLGIVVDTSSVSDNSFHDVTDALITRAGFFNQAGVNTLIKARGQLSGGSVTWDEMELES